MKTLERMLLGMSLPVWTFFAWLIACESDIFPESFRGTGSIFHWQIWLLGGIMLMVAREYVCDLERRRPALQESPQSSEQAIVAAVGKD